VRDFFTHYARNWMVAYTKESEAAVIASDVHSVAEVRINNVFANSKRGLRAFGCHGMPVCPDVP
jgi:predicted metalloendopeptidase